MMKNEFEELQKIYEGFRVVNGMNPPYKVEVKPVLGQKEPTVGPSYMGAALRGRGDYSQYNYNLGSDYNKGFGDEEVEHKPKSEDIKSGEVIEYIDKLMDEAQKSGKSFAIHQLGSLKKFVQRL